MHSLRSEATPPVRVVIPGDFWDSQIYAGWLYLFGRSGELITLSWTKLVAALDIPAELRVVADAALLGNHRLYEVGARQLVADPEIRPLLIDKFFRLAALTPSWEIPHSVGARIQDNLLPFPHNDSEIHYHRLYVAASSGLFGLGPGGPQDLDRRRIQYSDAPGLDIAAKYSTIAMASGSDGLYEVRLGSRRKAAAPEVQQLSKLPCVSCEWAFESVLASGFDSRVYVASFEKQREEVRQNSQRSNRRRFDRVIADDELFRTHPSSTIGISWGARDKIFRYQGGRVEVVRYTPGSGRTPEPQFEAIGEFELPTKEPTAEIVAARVAPFGSVIERDDSLLLLPTVGLPRVLPTEPVNWRVFPRSVDYLNHLHVVYDDRLEIWAFTHDYFADQANKLVGIGVGGSDE